MFCLNRDCINTDSYARVVSQNNNRNNVICMTISYAKCVNGASLNTNSNVSGEGTYSNTVAME